MENRESHRRMYRSCHCPQVLQLMIQQYDDYAIATSAVSHARQPLSKRET